MSSSSSSDNVRSQARRRFRESDFADLPSGDAPSGAGDPPFDIFEWYPNYQSCQRYFLDHSQHSVPIQALASFINILLPFQRLPYPVHGSSAAGHAAGSSGGRNQGPRGMQSPTLPPPAPSSVSLIPFVRRLVATGMDFPGILHGFFGDDWAAGVGPMHEQERRNYLFAAKSGGWAAVKRDYDMPPLETVPFLRPLQRVSNTEIDAAERTWSEWLAMEDWMVGPRSPGSTRPTSRSRMSEDHEL